MGVCFDFKCLLYLTHNIEVVEKSISFVSCFHIKVVATCSPCESESARARAQASFPSYWGVVETPPGGESRYPHVLCPPSKHKPRAKGISKQTSLKKGSKQKEFLFGFLAFLVM